MNSIATARVAVMLVVSFALVPGAHGQSNDAFNVYKQYLAVLAKADSLESLLPYYTKELSSGLTRMPTDMQANYLKMNRRTLTDVKVSKQQVDANKAYFEMSAKAADGQQTTGSATLVKEGGTWKIDDEAWIANLPKRPGLQARPRQVIEIIEARQSTRDPSPLGAAPPVTGQSSARRPRCAHDQCCDMVGCDDDDRPIRHPGLGDGLTSAHVSPTRNNSDS